MAKHRFTFSIDDRTDPDLCRELQLLLPKHGADYGALSAYVRQALRAQFPAGASAARQLRAGDLPTEPAAKIDLALFGFKKH